MYDMNAPQAATECPEEARTDSHAKLVSGTRDQFLSFLLNCFQAATHLMMWGAFSD
jgi:hypothetical protein